MTSEAIFIHSTSRPNTNKYQLNGGPLLDSQLPSHLNERSKISFHEYLNLTKIPSNTRSIYRESARAFVEALHIVLRSRIETDVMKLMSDYEVTLVNDNMYALF
ncbi:hypothetical protein WAI453_009749 [Rhynchosporium graminicola]